LSLDGKSMGGIPHHERYWDDPPLDMAPSHNHRESAPDALGRSIAAGATVAAIGPVTNLAELERTRPGSFRDVRVVAMAGWFDPVGPGYPDWGPEADWNVQCDPTAAAIVAASADLTLVPLSVTTHVWLRRSELPRLQAAGVLGRLLARQAVAYCEDEGKTEIALAHKALPDDLLNFHHDPLAAAVAAGWDGPARETIRVSPLLDRDVLRFQPDVSGHLVDVVTGVNPVGFDDLWINAVERAAAASPPGASTGRRLHP
jgi:inosine-uridine nucleoside N-ribohydrolase